MDAQPEVEREIATDLVKRAAMISPVVVILVAGLIERLGRRGERGDRAR